MNYIKHTIAAHERLRQQPEASPHHVSLYWALFFAWNAEFFEGALELDHQATMQAAHIGNKRTYTATLYELETFGLLTYQPSKSKHHPSRCYLTDLSGAKVPSVKPPTCGKSATGKTSPPVAEVPQALVADLPQVEALPVALLPQHSLLIQTFSKTVLPNVGGTEKKGGEKFPGEGLSEVEVLDETAASSGEQLTLGAAPKKKVAPKKKGVGQGPPATTTSTTAGPAEPRRRGGRPQRPEVPFAESELATYEAFAAAFAGTDYDLADLRFYHEKVLNWRQKGEVPRRRDWKATATQFFLNDVHDNRLKLAPGTQRHEPGTSTGTTPNAGSPAAGYRSKRWD